MILNIPPGFPAVELLGKENIFLTKDSYPDKKEFNNLPLKIALVNLMPLKITTETDFLRLLSNSPLPLEIDFIKIKGHQSKNTSQEHLDLFYKNFEDIRDNNYDGLIITGAPIELLEFEEVNYWNEIQEILNWARERIPSTLYICWAAQAALYHFYGVPKYSLPAKVFGVFKHTLHHPGIPLFYGFDDEFYVPHSRHTEIKREDILKHSELTLLSESPEAGVYMLMSRNGKDIYITGHSEYAREALHNEYIRDKGKNIPINIPHNYYIQDDPQKGINMRWRGHAQLMFQNWLNHYVATSASRD